MTAADRSGPPRRPLSILLLSWELPPFVAGGAWTATYHLVRRLHARGVAVSVLTPWRQDRLAPSPFGVLPGDPVEVRGLGVDPDRLCQRPVLAAPGWRDRSPCGTDPNPYHFTCRPLSGDQSLGILRTAFSRALGSDPGLDRGRFDVVHAVDWVTFTSGAAVAHRLGVPWTAHFHSVERERRPEPVERISTLEGWAVRNAALVVAPSRSTRAHVARDYGAGPGPVCVVPNSISDTRKRPPPGDAGKVTAFVGRYSHYKGPDLFVRVAEAAGAEDRSIEFRIYGFDKERLGRMRLRPGTNLRFMGPVPWDRRRAAFEAARLVVMTSRVEPFGMVALEAMTYGVPVMFPGHAGIAEVVSAGEHIDPDDTDDTARRVVRLVNDEDLLSAMVKQQDEEIDRYAASAPELELVRALEDVLAGQR